jgi:uncharacterized protein YcbK (DUF882 family)
MRQSRGEHFAHTPSRRGILRLGTIAGATVLSSRYALARQCRSLSLYAVHTGERLKVDYCVDGRYEPGALRAIARLMRDVHTDAVHHIDTTLLDALSRLGRILGTREPLHVTSGYRTHETNERLRRHDHDIAANSYHVAGKAADVFVPGRNLASVRHVARALEVGGVGYYPRSGFVHVDTGPIRTW